jgi:hypothetical protein
MGHLPTVEGPERSQEGGKDEKVQRNLSRSFPLFSASCDHSGNIVAGRLLFPGPARARTAAIWCPHAAALPPEHRAVRDGSLESRDHSGHGRGGFGAAPRRPWVDVRQCQGRRRSASGALVTADISVPLVPSSRRTTPLSEVETQPRSSTGAIDRRPLAAFAPLVL